MSTYDFNLDFIVKSSYESFSYAEGKSVLSNKWFTFKWPLRAINGTINALGVIKVSTDIFSSL